MKQTTVDFLKPKPSTTSSNLQAASSKPIQPKPRTSRPLMTFKQFVEERNKAKL